MKKGSIEKFLTDEIEHYINYRRLANNIFPEKWVDDQDELIRLAACLSEDKAINLMNVSVNKLKILLKRDDNLFMWESDCEDEPLVIYEMGYLFRIINKELKNIGKPDLGLCLGYTVLHLLGALRVYKYLEEHPNSKDALYVKWGKELEQYEDTIDHFQNAKDSLAKKVRVIFRKKKGYDLSEDRYLKNDYQIQVVRDKPIDPLDFSIYELANNKFPDSIEDSILAAARGGADYLPDDLAFDLLNLRESHKVEYALVIRDKLRDKEKEIIALRELVNQKKEKPEKLEKAVRKYNNFFRRDVSLNDSENEDQFDENKGVDFESNIMIEYFIRDTDAHSIKENTKRKLCLELINWEKKQPKQSHLKRNVVEYIIRYLNNPPEDNENIFKVTYVADALGTDPKEIRRIFNEMSESIPSLKELILSS